MTEYSKKDQLRHMGVMAKNIAREKFGRKPEEITIDFSSNKERIEAKFKESNHEEYDIEDYNIQISESSLPAELRREVEYKQTPKEYSNTRGLGVVKATILGSAIFSLASFFPPTLKGEWMFRTASIALSGTAYVILRSKTKSIRKRESEENE